MSDVAKTIEAVWKIESTRLIAAIARVTHEIGIAEELAQDALVIALEVWPCCGRLSLKRLCGWGACWSSFSPANRKFMHSSH